MVYIVYKWCSDINILSDRTSSFNHGSLIQRKILAIVKAILYLNRIKILSNRKYFIVIYLYICTKNKGKKMCSFI